MSRKGIEDVSTAIGPPEVRAASRERLVPALTIASHPDVGRVGERALLDALHLGRTVALSRNAPDFAKPGSSLGAPLSDPFVSRKPIRFSTGDEGRVRVLVEEGGTPVAIGAPLHGAVEIGLDDLDGGVPLELAERVVLLLHLADPDASPAADTLDMVGESAGLRRVREHVERVADLRVPVLLRGETGTGKELVARAIHRKSPRRAGPFVSVNLGALPRELAAAELFGAERGAYTGATRDREGYFRAARGGTLFLDEVGEASPEVQVMLLRVLETGELYPVGSSSPIATDVRLVAATDADLAAHIRGGRFKAPLLHRLAGYEIRLPPLRERREDIGPLFHHFARAELAALGEIDRLSPKDPYAEPWLPAPIAARLVRFAWPGNIRQLRNVTRQIVIGSRGRQRVTLDPQLAEELEASPAPIAAAVSAPPIAPEAAAARRRRPAEVSEAELCAALREASWDLKRAADRLGIPRVSMYDLIERTPSIRTAGDLHPDEIARAHRACNGDLDAMVEALQVSKRALQRRLRELGLGPTSE